MQETLVERLRDQGHSASDPGVATDTDDPTEVLIRQIIGAVSNGGQGKLHRLDLTTVQAR